MEDRLTLTKLLKDWQQLMLGMREDQLAFHDLILGKLCRAQGIVYATTLIWPKPWKSALHKGIAVGFLKAIGFCNESKRTIFDVWCSDPRYLAAALPGLANRSIQSLQQITPAAQAARIETA